MSFDNSRFTFDAWKDYFGVVMEQGRVQLDSDWNEWLAELARRVQAGTLDTLGRAVYPSTTPNAFKISASTDSSGKKTVSIGAGRMYVDGLLVENHGLAVSWKQPVTTAVASGVQWDPALNELSGAPQPPDPNSAVTIDYTQQPYYPGATLPGGNGPFLAYLDVWRRAITYLEDPSLVDKAVAVDTTGRIQTVWQVKLLDVSNVAGASCATPDSSLPQAWQNLLLPSAGQLTTGVVPSTSSGPCCLSSNTGYTGMENQFYRVEIHQGGKPMPAGAATPVTSIPAGTATFKWSRDNASVETSVTGMASVTNTAGNPASQLTVQSLGRDQVLGFAPGNWIEITDDWQELNGQHGELHQIDSIDFTGKTITLDSPVNAGSFPTSTGLTDPARHTRLRRWDQAGKVYESDGTTVWVDLGATGSTGEIPVPPAGTTLILENGVTVTFGLNPTTGSFNVADFWTFAARTADGSVETLNQAYPRGIHHHYARLSVVTFPSSAPDCRVEWPPSVSAGGCCECTVTVQAADLTGGKTLQTILDQYKNSTTQVTICLMPGRYSLASPLRFSSAHSNITLEASQEGFTGQSPVVIQAQSGQESQFADGMLVFDNVLNVALRGIYFAVPLVTFNAPNSEFAGLPISSYQPDVQTAINNLVVSIGARAVNCTGLTIEGCEFGFADFEEDISNPNAVPFGVGILATGQCSDWRINGNTFAGAAAFLAGVLLAPSVAFAQPASFKSIRARIAAGAKRAGKTTATAEMAKAKETRLGTLGAVAGGMQSVLVAGASAPSLSANGGTVLPSTLDEAVFEGNTFNGLTIAAVMLGESGDVQFKDNQVETCTAGFWFVSPLEANAILFDPQAVALTGLSIAMGYPLPQGDTTPASQFVSVNSPPSAVRIYTGTANYTDTDGNSWTPDVKASTSMTITGGTLYQPAQPPTILSSPGGATATDQALYQAERYGNSFSYTFNKLSPGFYRVTLKFAEIWYTDPATNQGVRIFDVSINNTQVLNNLDVVTQAGAADVAYDQSFPNVVPNAQGQIVVQFNGTSLGADTNAKISAAEIEPQWGGPVSGSSEFAGFYDQLAQLAQQGFTGVLSMTMRLRVDDNEMQGLSSLGFLLLGDDQVQTGKTGSLVMAHNRFDTTTAAGGKFALAESFDVARMSYLPSAGETVATTGNVVGSTFLNLLDLVVLIGFVTRCSVTGNVFLNQKKDFGRRGCFLLFDGFLPSPAATTPPPELAVFGNIFQGRVFISPQRFPNNTSIPAPMNSWNFMNTVIH